MTLPAGKKGDLSLTAQSLRSGYINEGPECASLYTTSTTLTVENGTGSPYSTYIGVAPPGTAVVSAAHILFEQTDLSILPTVTPETTSATTSIGATPASSVPSSATGTVVQNETDG